MYTNISMTPELWHYFSHCAAATLCTKERPEFLEIFSQNTRAGRTEETIHTSHLMQTQSYFPVSGIFPVSSISTPVQKLYRCLMSRQQIQTWCWESACIYIFNYYYSVL